MLTKLIQEGDAIDYTPGSAVAAGDVVVQNDLVGIAVRDIAADALGALVVEGVFEMPKRPADAIDAGDKLYWNATSAVAVLGATSGTFLGKAIADAAALSEVVSVRLQQ